MNIYYFYSISFLVLQLFCTFKTLIIIKILKNNYDIYKPYIINTTNVKF